ncbi:MAG: dTDP-4-dehydrorhamnose 3,5-epimerase [Candidatus Omnitrophota bacterium]
MAFKFTKLTIPEVILIEPPVFTDERGFFAEIYKRDDFAEHGIKESFVQENHSGSSFKDVVRGLHYQKAPAAQTKLVRVIRGRIFDVAVDIRKASLTYGKWVSAELSAENRRMLYVPEGFAHGFCTLEDNTEVIYKCGAVYSPENDRGIKWDDPAIGIDWSVKNPILSEKDGRWPVLAEADNAF